MSPKRDKQGGKNMRNGVGEKSKMENGEGVASLVQGLQG